MHIITTNFNGNPNVGLYGFATDSYCLLAKDIPKKSVEEVERVLKVPVHQMNICGTNLLGAFLAGNSSMLLVPSIAFKEELAELKKTKIAFTVIDTKLTALGNNILCNDHGCIVNPDFSAKIKKQIRQALNVKVVPFTIAGLETVGSCAVLANERCVIHWDATQKEIRKVEEVLDVTAEHASVNMSNPYLHSGILANNHGLIVGDASGGPEVAHIDEALGFLDKEREAKTKP